MRDNQPQKTRDSKIRRRRKKKIQEILNYAQGKYSCEFSENFEKILYNISPDRDIQLPFVVIDALVKEWKVWKPYCTSESFITFMEDGITSLVKINTTATFHSPNLKGFIGEKAEIVKPLPDVLATSVSPLGILIVNGEPV